MIVPLAKVGCERAALRAGNGTGCALRRRALSLRDRYPSQAAMFNQPGTVPLFSLAKAPRSPARKLLSKEAPFSAVMMGQQMERAGNKISSCGWLVSPNFRGALRRFHLAMTKDRRPLSMLGLSTKTNLSNMCGHASFVALAFAYLETDVLLLR